MTCIPFIYLFIYLLFCISYQLCVIVKKLKNIWDKTRIFFSHLKIMKQLTKLFPFNPFASFGHVCDLFRNFFLIQKFEIHTRILNDFLFYVDFIIRSNKYLPIVRNASEYYLRHHISRRHLNVATFRKRDADLFKEILQ